MTWLYILLGILLFLALLLFIPIKLYASYNTDIRCNLYIWFVKIPLYPRKKKAKKKSEENKPSEKKKEEKKKKSVSKKDISDFVDLIKKIAKLAKGVLKDFFKHIIIKNLRLSIKIAGSDAADTAVKYGYCCSAVYPAVSAVVSTVKCKDYGVDILPDFNEKADSTVYFEIEAKTLLLWIILLVVKHGINGIKVLIKAT